MPAIAAAIDELHAGRALLFAEGVRRIARELRCAFDAADPAPLTARMEMLGVFDVLRGARSSALVPDPRRAACLDELERVFAVLAGAPPAPPAENWTTRLNAAVRAGASAPHGHYFALRWRNNGRATLLFLRTVLLDRFNAIATGEPTGARAFARESAPAPFTLESAQ